MSIWTSDALLPLCRLALSLCVVLPLAACMGEGTATGGLGFQGQAGPEMLRRAALYQGDVVLAGPEGYCLDRQSLKRGPASGFALIASCESLSGKAGTPVPPAVMTVTVLPAWRSAAQPDAASIAASLAPAEPLALDDGDGISLVQMAQGGDRVMPDGDPRHWRAGMLINGHVVGLAVYGPAGSAIAGEQGRDILLALAETLREQSPVQADLAGG